MALLSSTKDSDGTEHIKVGGTVQTRKPKGKVSEAGEAPERTQPVILTDYLHTTHPDTGVDVVFVPGEALPQWAAEAKAAEDTHTAKPATPRAKGSVAASEAKGAVTHG